jgi:hypothetical protein
MNMRRASFEYIYIYISLCRPANDYRRDSMGPSPLSTYLYSSLSLSMLPVSFVLPLDQKLSMSKPVGKNTTCVHSILGCKNRVKQRLVL